MNNEDLLDQKEIKSVSGLNLKALKDGETKKKIKSHQKKIINIQSRETVVARINSMKDIKHSATLEQSHTTVLPLNHTEILSTKQIKVLPPSKASSKLNIGLNRPIIAFEVDTEPAKPRRNLDKSNQGTSHSIYNYLNNKNLTINTHSNNHKHHQSSSISS